MRAEKSMSTPVDTHLNNKYSKDEDAGVMKKMSYF